MIKLFIFLGVESLYASDVHSILTCLNPNIVTINANEETKNEQGQIESTIDFSCDDDRLPCSVKLQEEWKVNERDSAFLDAGDTSLVAKKTRKLPGNHTHADGVISDIQSTAYFLLKSKQDGMFLEVTKQRVHTVPAVLMRIMGYYDPLNEYVSKIISISLSDPRQRALQIYLKSQPNIVRSIAGFYNGRLINNQVDDQTLIPRTTHTVLLSASALKNFNRLRNNIKYLNRASSWRHNIWILDRSSSLDLPADLQSKIQVQYIDQLPGIQQNELDAINQIKSIDEYSCYCFLRGFVVNKLGGWNLDKNVEIVQVFNRFSKAKFVGFLDDIFKPCLAFSCFGSVQNGSVLSSYVDKILYSTLSHPVDYGCGEYNAFINYGMCLLTQCALTKMEKGSSLVFPDISLPLHKDATKSAYDTDVSMQFSVVGVRFKN